jgi:DNA-binding MarR family transcriptional regulator
MNNITVLTSPGTVPEVCVAFNIGKAYRNVMRQFEHAFTELEISTMQYGLLVHIGKYQPASGKVISEATGHDPSTLSRTLSALLDREYVTVRQDTEGDRRRKLYQLTLRGEKALEAAIPVWQKTQNRIIAEIGTDNWKNVLRILRKIQEM